MASWLVCSTPDRVVRVQASVLRQDTYSHIAYLHPGVQMGTSKCAGGNPAMGE